MFFSQEQYVRYRDRLRKLLAATLPKVLKAYQARECIIGLVCAFKIVVMLCIKIMGQQRQCLSHVQSVDIVSATVLLSSHLPPSAVPSLRFV